MNLELKGENATIIGASKGIDRSIALALAEEGVKVCAESCDLGDIEKVEAFLNTVKLTFGMVDILVNNASALSLGRDDTDREASINIDLLASVKGTRKVIPWMIASGTGSILFISSGSGLEGGALAAYAAAKAALISYSKTLSVQLVPRNIRVNMIAPGAVEFGGGLWEMMKKHDKPFYDHVINTISSGRMRRPDEIAKVAAFFSFAFRHQGNRNLPIC